MVVLIHPFQNLNLISMKKSKLLDILMAACWFNVMWKQNFLVLQIIFFQFIYYFIAMRATKASKPVVSPVSLITKYLEWEQSWSFISQGFNMKLLFCTLIGSIVSFIWLVRWKTSEDFSKVQLQAGKYEVSVPFNQCKVPYRKLSLASLKTSWSHVPITPHFYVTTTKSRTFLHTLLILYLFICFYIFFLQIAELVEIIKKGKKKTFNRCFSTQHHDSFTQHQLEKWRSVCACLVLWQKDLSGATPHPHPQPPLLPILLHASLLLTSFCHFRFPTSPLSGLL